ncbi:MAG: type I-C CRISPR-associated protein Cas5 [Ruminococcaceae bacterium]|nr:type I-C CRISPR-associated protein Cas5 [Oscillospiraceae bacterium]
MEKFQSKPFYMKIWGDYALFTDPMTKAGGEKYTYQVPTYQALKGIVEACYWKPVLYYVMDEVKIIKPIQTETHGIRAPLNNGKNDLNSYTYLKDVEYWIKFHFEWNENRQDMNDDRDEIKHREILIRSMKRGGRRDIFLGARECVGYVDYLTENKYNNAKTAFENEKRSFGLQFHSFIYPDENENIRGDEGPLISCFSNTLIEDGCIKYCRPEECSSHHELSSYKIKSFPADSFTKVGEEHEALMVREDRHPVTEERDGS